jgi:hypothetical protein
MYADDLLLLAISLRDLQAMIDLCVEEFDNLDLKINIKKTVCMRIGKNHSEKVAFMSINSHLLDWKQEIRYLGVYILSGNSFKCNMQLARQKFFRALNGIFAKIGTKASPNVILSLVDAYCLPVLLYGIEAMTVNSKLSNCLDNAFRNVFAKIFFTYDKSTIMNCQYYCGILPLSYRIDLRSFVFYSGLKSSLNECLKFHFVRSGANEFDKLQKKYSVTTDFQLRHVLWTHFEKLCNF